MSLRRELGPDASNCLFELGSGSFAPCVCLGWRFKEARGEDRAGRAVFTTRYLTLVPDTGVFLLGAHSSFLVSFLTLDPLVLCPFPPFTLAGWCSLQAVFRKSSQAPVHTEAHVVVKTWGCFSEVGDEHPGARSRRGGWAFF